MRICNILASLEIIRVEAGRLRKMIEEEEIIKQIIP